LNFRLKIRISSERAEMPPTTSSKRQKSGIFSRAFDRRPAAEKIRSRFDMSSDSFVLAADKSPTLANNFLTRERHLFRSLQIDCAGGYLGFPIKDSAGGAMESPKRPVVRNR